MATARHRGYGYIRPPTPTTFEVQGAAGAVGLSKVDCRAGIHQYQVWETIDKNGRRTAGHKRCLRCTKIVYLPLGKVGV